MHTTLMHLVQCEARRTGWAFALTERNDETTRGVKVEVRLDKGWHSDTLRLEGIIYRESEDEKVIVLSVFL